jgi:uncharacterized membrane protein
MKYLFTFLLLGLFGCTPSESSNEPVVGVDTETNEQPEVIIEEVNTDDAEALLAQVQQGLVEFDFYASFTEPFWTFYLIDNQVLFNLMDDVPSIHQLDKSFDAMAEKQMVSFTKGDKKWTLSVEHKEGSDGMSEISYPYYVVVNNTYYGGGNTKLLKEE